MAFFGLLNLDSAPLISPFLTQKSLFFPPKAFVLTGPKSGDGNSRKKAKEAQKPSLKVQGLIRDGMSLKLSEKSAHLFNFALFAAHSIPGFQRCP
jgi:hypothetical protein